MAGEANLFHTFHDESTLDVKAYYFYSERGLPGAVILYNPKAEERLWTRISSPKPVIRKPSPQMDFAGASQVQPFLEQIRRYRREV